MIISNSRKYIFVHIHKTAGESVSATLAPSLQWNDLTCIHGPHEQVRSTENILYDRYGLHKHSHASEIRDVVGKPVWDDYFTFAFVRNPYYRILSLYTWLDKLVRRRGVSRYFARFARGPGLWRWPGTKAYLATRSFSEFIRHDALRDGAAGTRPMVDWLTDNGEVIVDFVGRFESIDKDFAHVAARIGLESAQLIHKNVSRSAVQLQDYYRGREDLDYVYDRYRKDFEVFGYDRL